MRVVSTFAGCGGSSTGYKLAGAEVVAAVEWEEHAVQCYRANHPTTKVFHGDIAKVDPEAILNATGLDVGELDLLDGSPPCQGFSTAGKRILDDPRNSLFREHLRLVDALEPKCVVIENVAGMIRGKMKPVAGEIVRSLKDRGYKVSAGLLEAQYFGVAQRRPRVFFIGSRVGQPHLPKAISRKVTAGKALEGIDPGYVQPTTAPSNRLFLRHARPGEQGCDVRARLGMDRPGSWFSIVMLNPKRPSPTLTKVAQQFYHWKRRVLTTRERLVLTGFPVDYQLPGNFAQQCARIGNSVAPPMTREIARQVIMPLLERD